MLHSQLLRPSNAQFLSFWDEGVIVAAVVIARAAVRERNERTDLGGYSS